MDKCRPVRPFHVYISTRFSLAYCWILMQISGLALREGDRSFEFILSWSLRCFRKMWYHLETMYACVASVRTVQQCPHLQIFMSSYAIWSEWAMYYWQISWMFHLWWWVMLSPWLSGLRLWVNRRYPELELFACIKISFLLWLHSGWTPLIEGWRFSWLQGGESHCVVFGCWMPLFLLRVVDDCRGNNELNDESCTSMSFLVRNWDSEAVAGSDETSVPPLSLWIY